MTEEETSDNSIFKHLEDNFRSAIGVFKGFNSGNLPTYLGFALVVGVGAVVLSMITTQLFSLLNIGPSAGYDRSLYELSINSTFTAFYQSIPVLAIGLFALMLKGENLREGITLGNIFSKITPPIWKNFGISLSILFVCSLFVPEYYGFGWEDISGINDYNEMKSFFYNLIYLVYFLLPFYLAVICYHAGEEKLDFFARIRSMKVLAGVLMLLAINYLGQSLIHVVSEQASGLIRGISGNLSMSNITDMAASFLLGLLILPAKARALGPSKETANDLDNEDFLDSDVIDDVL